MTVNLANEMSNYFKVYILVLGKNINLSNKLNQKVEIIYFKKKRALHAIFLLNKTLKNIKPNYIFSSITHINIIVLLSKLLFSFQSKLLIRETTNLLLKFQKFTVMNLIFKILIKLFYNFADLIVVPSIDLKIILSKNFNLNKNKIYIMNNPLDTNFIDNAYCEKVLLPFQKEKNLKIAIFVGRLDKVKNLNFIINSFSKFIKNHKNWKLLIIGNGSELEDLKLMIKKMKMNQHIKILNNLKNHFSYYKFANLYIQYSKREGISNSLLEALYFEVPVIISNISKGQNEILEKFNCGLIVDNEKNLNNAFMLANKNKITKSSKSMIKKMYDSKNVVKNILFKINTL